MKKKIEKWCSVFFSIHAECIILNNIFLLQLELRSIAHKMDSKKDKCR